MVGHARTTTAPQVVVCVLVDGGAVVVCELVDGGAVVVCALVDGRPV